MLLLSIAGVILTGIWLTGFRYIGVDGAILFDKFHWVLYVPVLFLSFAGITVSARG